MLFIHGKGSEGKDRSPLLFKTHKSPLLFNLHCHRLRETTQRLPTRESQTKAAWEEEDKRLHDKDRGRRVCGMGASHVVWVRQPSCPKLLVNFSNSSSCSGPTEALQVLRVFWKSPNVTGGATSLSAPATLPHTPSGVSAGSLIKRQTLIKRQGPR